MTIQVVILFILIYRKQQGLQSPFIQIRIGNSTSPVLNFKQIKMNNTGVSNKVIATQYPALELAPYTTLLTEALHFQR